MSCLRRWIIHSLFLLFSICVRIEGDAAIPEAPGSKKDAKRMLPRPAHSEMQYRGLNFMIIFVENINYLQDILDSNNAESNESIVQLPNIQKLRKESILFDHAYSELHSASSSATLLTGLPAVDTGIIKGKILPFTEIPSVASTGGLQYIHATLAESIKHVTQGYEMPNYLTAFVGYWKLGHGQGGMYLPHNRGFDFWTGVSFTHSNSCIGRKKSFKPSWRRGNAGYHYVDLIYDILPWLIGILIGIYSAYYFQVITSKGLLNSLLYFFLATFVFFALLEVYRVQKSATCLLYHMNEITEQPYNMENLTLFFTSNVLALLDFFSEQSQPFFVSMNYLKLREPHFSSKYFKQNQSKEKIVNSLLELDWSIGKIMAKFEELQFTENTMIFLTGNSDCKMSSQDQKIYAAYERKASNMFQKMSVSDVIEQCMQVPLYLKQTKVRTEKQRTSVPISFLDIAPTILELITNITQDDYPGCSIVPAMSSWQNQTAMFFPKVYELQQTGIVDESVQNKHRCNPEDRLHIHFADIRRPIAVTVGGSLRLILSNLDEAGCVKKLDFPVIRRLQSNSTMHNLSYMEEIYQNISNHVEKWQSKRKNKWSSQFEMPIYPWILPCANFPRCEASSHTLSDFSFLEPIAAGAISDMKPGTDGNEGLPSE